MRLLLVEDEPALALALERGLEDHGFAVDHAGTGAEARAFLRSYDYTAVILDRMLPDGDGAALCDAARSRNPRVGLLMLTARDAVEERVEGLNAGADDYLVKPFAFPELLARLHGLTQRHVIGRSNRLEARGVVVELDAWRASRRGQPVALSPKELSLLAYLMRFPGQVVSTSRLLEQLWDAESSPGPEVVRAHVKNLRRKLESPGEPPLIRTVYGVGYRFEA